MLKNNKPDVQSVKKKSQYKSEVDEEKRIS